MSSKNWSRFTVYLLIFLAGTSLPQNAIAQVRVQGYLKRDGSYVAPHHRNLPNSTKLDNWSTKGNINPYTGKLGTQSPDKKTYNPNWHSYPLPFNYPQDTVPINPTPPSGITSLSTAPTLNIPQGQQQIRAYLFREDTEGITVEQIKLTDKLLLSTENFGSILFVVGNSRIQSMEISLIGPVPLRCGDGPYSDMPFGQGYCILPINRNTPYFAIEPGPTWPTGDYIMSFIQAQTNEEFIFAFKIL